MRSLNKTAGQEKFHELFGPKADYTTIRLKRIELMDAFIEKEGAAAKPGICGARRSWAFRRKAALRWRTPPPEFCRLTVPAACRC